MVKFITQTIILSVILCVACSAEQAQQSAQATKYTFEGKSVVVEVPDEGQRCSVLYGQNPTITNIDGSAPTDLSTCDGRALAPQNGRAIVQRNETTGYFCFRGSKPVYSITFPQGTKGTRTYQRWLPKEKTEAGFINVRDFGAVGDGNTDDTEAIRNAIAFIAAQQGGTLFFPPGNYVVGGSGDFKGLGLPSGIVILGASSLPRESLHNYFEPKQFSQIRVRRPNQRVFRIGECTTDVKIKNLALRADSNQNTYGIEAVGNYRGTPTNHVGLEDVSMSGFDIGFYAHNSGQTSPEWQFDIIRVEHCSFMFNRTAGILVDTYNTDWRISSSTFLMPGTSASDPADGIKFKVGGMALIENSFGGGLSYQPNQRGGDFLDLEVVGAVTVINSAAERATNSLLYAQKPGMGGYSYTLTLINNVFLEPVRVRRVHLVSTGNTYGARTVQTGDGAQIYSTGDRFCLDSTQNYAPNENPPRFPCGEANLTSGGFQGEGKIVFQTGQLKDTSFVNPNVSVAERPMIIGTETQFNAPVRLPSYRSSELPSNRPAGSQVFCSDCQKNTSPCRAGGSGALALSIGAQWDCK